MHFVAHPVLASIFHSSHQIIINGNSTISILGMIG